MICIRSCLRGDSLFVMWEQHDDVPVIMPHMQCEKPFYIPFIWVFAGNISCKNKTGLLPSRWPPFPRPPQTTLMGIIKDQQFTSENFARILRERLLSGSQEDLCQYPFSGHGRAVSIISVICIVRRRRHRNIFFHRVWVQEEGCQHGPGRHRQTRSLSTGIR